MFTYIPLEETINIGTNALFGNTEGGERCIKNKFKELFSLAREESYFILNGKHYKEVNRVAMGSPLGPTLANAFRVYFCSPHQNI